MNREEAIKILRETHDKSEFSVRNALETLAPELRESEDERMMREFNDWLCEEIECRTNDLRDEKDRRTLNMLCYVLRKVKDWLEKQKEQKSLPPVSSGARYYFDEWIKQQPILKYWDAFLAGIDFNKKEQPNLELIQRSWYMEGYTDGEFKREPMWNLVTGKGGPKYEENEKYGQPLEQKPVDEPFEEWIDGWYNEHHRDGYITMDEREFKNFCLGIRNMYAEQRPAEWSEEDEKDMAYIIQILYDCYVYKKHNLSKTDYDNLVNKLKSIRSQPRWKPSEEQMDWLGQAILDCKNICEKKALSSLYEQLKAL